MMEKYSMAMKLLLKLKLEPWAWAIRKFHTPVNSDDLVLEVGSGGNPYPRSNVLLDAYEDTRERHWVPLTVDRPTVLGFVENLPFKDKTFDFVIASHVLEHSTDPEKFLSELQRVAKAGYIEVPDAFLEVINPYKDHRLEITKRNDRLIITKKSAWINHPKLVELYEDRVKKYLTTELAPKRPFEFHVRYYWKDNIFYTVTNPDINTNWKSPEPTKYDTGLTLKAKLREFIRITIGRILSRKSRKKSVNLVSLLRCTKCHSEDISQKNNMVICRKCDSQFPIKNGLVIMNSSVK